MKVLFRDSSGEEKKKKEVCGMCSSILSARLWPIYQPRCRVNRQVLKPLGPCGCYSERCAAWWPWRRLPRGSAARERFQCVLLARGA